MLRREGRLPTRDLTRSLMLVVLFGVGLVVALLVAYRALPVLEVVAVAILLALVLRTVVTGLERLGLPPLASAFVLLLILAGFGALLYFVILPGVAGQIRGLAARGPGSLSAVQGLLQGLPFAPDLSEVVGRVESALGRLLGSVPAILSAATGAVGAIVSAVFLAIYLAISPDTYLRGLLRLVPEGRRARVRRFIDVLANRLRGWISGTLIVSSFVGAGAGLGLWLLGVPLPLTFGILAGILNIIPLFGSILAAVPPVLLALTISPTTALWVAILFVALNQIDGNLLQPQIMGRQVHVPPAMILVAILLLGTLLGPIIGTLLAIPVAVTVVTLVEQFTKNGNPEDAQQAEEKTETAGARNRKP